MTLTEVPPLKGDAITFVTFRVFPKEKKSRKSISLKILISGESYASKLSNRVFFRVWLLRDFSRLSQMERVMLQLLGREVTDGA